jgi:uncharacterized phage protein gp47/JayE
VSGLTDTGYEPRTQAEIFESQQDFLRATISAKLILTDKTVLGNWVRVTSDHLALLEEAQEEAYNAYDRDSSTSDRLSSLMTLMGVPRRTTSTTGLVSVTLTLGAGQAFAAGDLVAAVDGEPDNTWHNRDAVTSVGSGSYTAVFESDLTGPDARALAGTLTEIPTPVSGWTAITNATDAQAGKGPETDAEGRVRLAQAVGSGGSNHAAAVRAALVAVQGVLSADVFENRTGFPDTNGVPPHSIRCVVWDGSPAVAKDADIAQAIWDHSATFAAGSDQGEAQDSALGTVTVNFDRATASAVTVAVAIESAQGVTKADVKAALIAAMPGQVGAGITLHKLAKAVFDVPGVDDYGTFTINGGTSDLAAVQTTIYTLSSGDVTVTGDAT